MFTRKNLISGLGLLVVTLVLGIGLGISFAEKALAREVGACKIFYQNCPSQSPCPGIPCESVHDRKGGTNCCGSAPVSWDCWNS